METHTKKIDLQVFVCSALYNSSHLRGSHVTTAALLHAFPFVTTTNGAPVSVCVCVRVCHRIYQGTRYQVYDRIHSDDKHLKNNGATSALYFHLLLLYLYHTVFQALNFVTATVLHSSPKSTSSLGDSHGRCCYIARIVLVLQNLSLIHI